MFSRVVGQGLELRLLEDRYAEELFGLSDRSREHLRPWMPWIDRTRCVEDTRAFIRGSLEEYSRGEALVTGIFYNGNVAGVLSFHNIDRVNRSATIDYWIGVEYQRKGLSRSAEAFRASVGHQAVVEPRRLRFKNSRCGGRDSNP
ncbi:MAG TPA: GNAT family N-acetyltransferase [Methanocella sp.]|uniref:GNAT family N-acetyltransferase n=1 Tax=Methanocella sp. TaxID=2052833 RepID=UPI002CB6D09B|nr:GNAT family N-acetyltransferase [Methanocella sp.]HTY91106.1 GNAT family N-acetyltransferase [Methanocella sp.]